MNKKIARATGNNDIYSVARCLPPLTPLPGGVGVSCLSLTNVKDRIKNYLELAPTSAKISSTVASESTPSESVP
jgi:hypothetical protein